MTKLNVDHHIVVELNLDELDLPDIAQVKQKYGIIERENYNNPKSVDAKQPDRIGNELRALLERNSKVLLVALLY